MQVSAEDISMISYTEHYLVTRKKHVTDVRQSVDLTGRIIEPRKSSDREVVLDIKCRITPPDIDDEKGVPEPRHCMFIIVLWKIFS